MTDWSIGGVSMGVATGPARQVDPGAPFRIAILGDFSGRASRGEGDPAGIAGRRIWPVDRDNFEDVMARVAPRLLLSLPGGGLTVDYRELDDFGPDALVQRIELFDRLRGLRRRLLNTNTFAAAAAEVTEAVGAAPAEPEATADDSAADERPAGEFTTDDLFAATLAATSEEAPKPVAPETQLVDRLIREVVGPHVIPAPDPRQDELVAAVDAAIGGQLRAILHAPAARALEAAWRGLYLLVRRLETDSGLTLSLIDIGQDEVAADLAAAEAPERSGMYKLLVEPTVGVEGAQPWGLLIADWTFGANEDDAGVLARLGAIAAAAGAPCVAGAAPSLVGADDLMATPDPDDWQPALEAPVDAAWAALRGQPVARSLGLTLPRLLLRRPYGRNSDPIESFAFEELSADDAVDALPWTNGAFAVGLVLGEAFTTQGWGMRTVGDATVGDLPLAYVEIDGETALVPCAEILLGTRGTDRLASRGLIPLRSVRDSDAVRVGPVRSLAADGAPLAGRWAGGA